MSISPTSLALNSAVSATGITNSGHSARAYPLPVSLVSSTLLPPLSYQPSNQSPSETQSLPDTRSAFFPSTMSSVEGGLSLPTSIGIIGPHSQSTSPPSTSDHPGSSTYTTPRTGRSLRFPSTLTSNAIISASPSSPTTSGVSTAVSTITSRIYAVITFTLTPTPIHPFPTDSTTQPFSSPTPESSISSPTSPSPSSRLPSTSPVPTSTHHTSSAVESTTILIPTTVHTTVTPSSVPVQSPSTSTYTTISVLQGNGGTTTSFVTSSGVLSTETSNVLGSNVTPSPGMIVGIVLGIVGAFAFASLWLFCARRRHRKLVQEAAFITPQHHASPLGDEVPDVEELGYGSNHIYGTGSATTRSGPLVEERYAGILAALHSTEGFGRGLVEGSTGGIYGSQRDGTTDGDDDIARASSPTLPNCSIPPDDLPYTLALSPPPSAPSPLRQQAARSVPPPSAYYASRRRSSPGPDGASWFGGYSVAPSCASHYARSQTLGSGSGSGSVDALTRTHTGSEEPLISIRRPSVELFPGVPSSGGISPTTTTDLGGNRRLGSAFGSPEGSMYSPSAISPTLHRDISGSYDALSVYGSGSYGHTRSGTPSSFDVLGSVSSQGALSSSYNHGHGPNQGSRFGVGRPESASTGSTGKKRGSGQHSFGVPPTSFRAWRDWGLGSATSDKEKPGEKLSFRERDWRRRTGSGTSASSSGSMDEKQEKSSPVMGVRILLERLRRAGHTPSPRSSNRDLPSPTLRNSTDVDPEKATGNMSVERVTPPPPPIHIVQAVTRQNRRQYSFILSNPDPHPPSPYSGTGDVAPSSDGPLHQGILPNPYDTPPHPHNLSPSAGELHPGTTLPIGYVPVMSVPSPAPTEESRLVEGLLHPRLRAQGRSDASLMDFEDYSRPIGAVVKNRMYSTTTFGTQDDSETMSPSGGTPVQEIDDEEHEHNDETLDVFGASTVRTPCESWFVDDAHHRSARNSPIGGV